MTLETEDDLVTTYEKNARLYRLAERMQSDAAANEDLRAAEVEGVRAMIRKMERQIIAYYESHPERLQLPQQAA